MLQLPTVMEVLITMLLLQIVISDDPTELQTLTIHPETEAMEVGSINLGMEEEVTMGATEMNLEVMAFGRRAGIEVEKEHTNTKA